MKLAAYVWYAVMTNARAEQVAADDMEHLGYTPLFLHVSAQQGGNKRKSWLVKRPYLPRYVFVGLEPTTHFVDGVPLLHKISSARGVSSLVRAPGGDPFPISTRAMELITAKAELPGGLVHTKKPLLNFPGAPGYSVRLSDKSAYQGLIAAIMHIDPRGEIRVEIESFGRKVPTRITLEDVGQLFDKDGNPVDKFEPSRTETSGS